MNSDHDLTGKTIALLATDGFEDSELTEPLEAVKSAGAEVVIISDGSDVITGKDGTEIDATKTIDEVSEEEFDGLLLPGGVANPDRMRMNETAVEFVHDFFVAHKPVAAICHAPWLLVEADVVLGRTLTSWPSLRTDITNAGGKWVDEPVVIDENLVTSRKPDDLDVFSSSAIELFAHASDPEAL